MPRRGSDSGRYAVIWLATAYTAFIGLAPVAVVIVVANEHPEYQLLAICGAVAFIVLWILFSHIRWDGPVNRLSYWLFAHERNDPTDAYRAARRRIASREQYGNNQPPNLDSVRDAANHGGAWVPRSNIERRSNRRSD
jgi:hypothetical protein